MYASNNWDHLSAGRSIQVAPLNETVQAEYVSFKDRDKDSYGDYYQGDDTVYVIFKVGDRFFKKIGYKSSYSEQMTWDGECIEVFPKTKTIQVFE